VGENGGVVVESERTRATEGIERVRRGVPGMNVSGKGIGSSVISSDN
jgi:hypothetical protein